MINPFPKPHYIPRPEPRRLPERKAVTIIVGLCGNDGVVIAADSQETITGYIKNERGKIRTTIFHDTNNVFAIAGAGSSDYIDTARDKALEGMGELDDFGKLKAKLETNLLGFFHKHLAPWAYFPDNERPTVELLIGLTMKKGPYGLFHYSGTSFHQVSEKAIGAGILLANDLLSRFSTAGASVEKSSSIAVYVIWKVKGQVDSCGGFTDLVAFRKNGDYALTESKDIKEVEGVLDHIEKESTTVLKREVELKTVKLSWFGGREV